MSVISNSFKKIAAQKFAKSSGADEKTQQLMVDAWTKGFDLAESMFTEQV